MRLEMKPRPISKEFQGDAGLLDLEKKDDILVTVQVPTDEFPEGGLQAWLTVFGAFLVQYTTYGYVNAFGVYQDFYVRRYLTDFTPSDIGWIGGVQILCTFSTGVFVGRAFDRGYFRQLMFMGAFLHAVGLFMLSISHENSFYQVFLTNGVAVGLSGGLCYIPSLGIASHYFQRRRALAIGIVSSGTALGGILHPIMLNKFFNGPIGFHNGVRISAAINTVLLLIACSIMRTRLPPKTIQHFPVRSWLQEPAYFFIFIAASFIFLGLFFPLFNLQLAAVTHDVDSAFAFYSISILNAASVFGRIIPASLGPRFGVFNLAVLSVTASGIAGTCMIFVKDVVGTTLFAVFFGITSGAGIGLFPSVIAMMCKHMNELGTRMGICFFFSGIVGLFGSPISGALLTKKYHWLNADLFAGLSLVIAGSCFVISRYFLVKQRGTQWL